MEDNMESSARYKIASLRQAGNLEGALTELLQAVARNDRPAYRHHLLGSRCLLLEWAQWANGVPFDRDRFAPLLSLTGPSRDLLPPRIDVIEAIRVDHDPDKIIELLVGAVEEYERCFQYKKKDFITDAEERLKAADAEPAFMARLIKHRELFRPLAEEFGWLHPGLLLVGETWAFVNGQAKDLSADYWVETSGLLADMDDWLPDGYAPKLRLERIRGGCGAFYPHPLRSGYLATERSFQDSLQNAWWAVRASSARSDPDGNGHWALNQFDVRWSLTIVDHEHDLPLDVHVKGRSMEVALACALRALLAGEPVDQDVAVTAIFKNPGTRDLSLDRVAGLREKLLAPEFEPTARRRLIKKVVVASNQPEVTESGTARETKIANGQVTLVPAADFDAAHGYQGRWAKITQLAKQRLFERAERILKQQCDPYIPPLLSREDRGGERGVDALGRPIRSPVPDEELARIVCGDLPRERNRLFVQGDSGMGKSMFLVCCEQEIAKGPRLILPLRVGAGPTVLPEKPKEGEQGQEPPSGIDWTKELREPLSRVDWTNLDTALKSLADHVLNFVLPEHKDDLQEWLRYLVSCKSVVFLLDALDQTKDDVDKLPAVLQGKDIAECPVVMTGRCETEQTKRDVRQIDWDVVWTDPFKEKQQRDFLGPVLADRLLAKPEDINRYIKEVLGTLPVSEQLIQYARINEAWARNEQHFVPAGEDRKLQWEKLLQVPILLHELRNLAQTEQLDGLKNRESVYARLLDRLIDKGLESADTSSKPPPTGWDVPRVRKRLADLAWEMILAEASTAGPVAENFTGEFSRKLDGDGDGEAFGTFCETHESILDTLGQIDITRLESVPNKRVYHKFAFRHFSYCEYFAGLKLANLSSEQRTAVVQQHARDPRWRWIFRYALSCAERERKRAALGELAYALIRYGNPFWVYDAMAEDKVDLRHLALPAGVPETLDLDRLCRWLVHRDLGPEGSYLGALGQDGGAPAVDSATLDILESLFDRRYRNGRCLHPAWELLGSSDDPRAVEIRERFLSEFPRLLKAKSKQGEIAVQLVNGFVRCPKDPKDDRVPFWMGAADGEEGADEDERPQHQVVISPFEMQATQVTNEQYELFDPSHRRDRFSPDPACPVIYVNWYMATMFRVWLGAGYRLPTEGEWEYGCRARPGGDRRTPRFCMGDEDADLAKTGWYWENWGEKERRTHTVRGKPGNAFDVYDMHGNVFEWCEDWYGEYREGQAEDPPGPAEGSYRVFRGGGWYGDAWICRSAFRYGHWPGYRSRFLGFRLARSLSGLVPEIAEPVT